MISMTKLYDYLNWAFALVVLLIITTFASTVLSYYAIKDTVIDTSQFIQNSIDYTRQDIRNDLKIITSKLNANAEAVGIIQEWMVYVTDNIKSSWSTIHNDINIQLVHYIAEVEICSIKFPTQKVKVDFYWINPRIESNRLLILDERYFSDYEAANVYLPIYDKNTDYDANLCSIKILSSSNK